MANDDFRFKIDRVRSQFLKTELIGSLQAFSQLNEGTVIAMRDYDSWSGRISTSDTIRRYFGTWGKALQAAGLRSSRGRKLDAEIMVTAFKDCWRSSGSVPSVRRFEAFLEKGNYPFRYKSYQNVWGGLGPLAQLIVEVQEGRMAESKLFKRRTSNAISHRAITLKLRTEILKRDGYCCVKCGASPKADKSVRLEVDHKIAVSRGGTSVPVNLQTLCFACNQGKKNRDD